MGRTQRYRLLYTFKVLDNLQEMKVSENDDDILVDVVGQYHRACCIV